MTNTNCEYVRELYPDILHGRADAAMSARVRAHVASCDECLADTAVLDQLYARQIAVPAGLEARTITAVRNRRTPRWYVGKSELLMAATLAAALIGGSAIVQMHSDDVKNLRPTPAVQRSTPSGIGSVGVEEAMISGKSSLEDLSVEQLQKLLGEMES